MDPNTFERWLSDLANEYRDTQDLWHNIEGMKVLNGFVGWAETRYALELENLARDKAADPACCGGACQEDVDAPPV